MYGLTIDAVETVAREGLACVVHMELEVECYVYTNLTREKFQNLHYSDTRACVGPIGSLFVLACFGEYTVIL